MPVLSIDIEAKFAQVTDALTRIEGQAKKTATSVSSILGGIGVGLSFAGFGAFIKSVADSQESLYKLSITTGETVERLAQLRSLAKTTGTDFDGIADAMAKLSRNMSTSGENTATVSGAFKFLGISARDAAGNLKPIGDVMLEISKKLVTYQDGAGKVAVVQDLLGKGAANLIPYLDELGKATDLHTKVTRESVDAAHEFELQLREMEKQSLATKNALGNELIPVLSELLRTFNELKAAGGWLAVVFGTKADIEDPLTQLRTAEEMLEKLKKTRDDFGKAHPLAQLFSLDDAKALDLQIGAQTARIAALKKLAEIQSSRRPEAPGFGDTDAPVAPTKLKLKYNRKDPKNISEDAGFGALADARAKIEVDATKRAADFKQQLLDKEHATALISEQDYWAERFRIQDEAINIDIKAEEKRVARRQALLDNAQNEKPSIRNAAQKGLEEAQAALDEKRETKTRQNILLTTEAEAAAKRIKFESGQLAVRAYEEEKSVTDRVKDSVQDYTDAVRLDNQEQQLALDLIGRNTAAQEKAVGLRRLQLEFDNRIAALPNRGEGQTKALEDLQIQLDKAKASFIEFYDAIREKGRSAFVGATGALTEYIDHATNAAEQTKNALTNAFKSAEDALVDFVKTGKLNFKALADSIITDLIRITAQRSLAGAGQGLLQLLGGPGGGGPSAAAIQAGGSANGNVFSRGSIVPYAMGGIVNGPTLFRMANGAGLMGEAGPEAVMPLKRGADGKLGVVAQRTSGGISVTNHLTYNAASGDDDRSNADRIGAMIDQRTRASVMSILVQQKRAGGILAS